MLIIASMEFDKEERAGRSVRFVVWGFSLLFPTLFASPAKRDCMMKFHRGVLENQSGFLLLLVLRMGLQMGQQ